MNILKLKSNEFMNEALENQKLSTGTVKAQKV